MHLNRVRAKSRLFISLAFAFVLGALALVSHLQIDEARKEGKVTVMNRATPGAAVTVISAPREPREFADNLQSKEIFRGAFLLGLVLTAGFAARYGYWLRQHPR
jgi:hypothetical protein